MRVMDDPTIKDFESALAELETVVQTLEDGQLTLEQSLERFERGITLSRYCHQRLEAAEKANRASERAGRTAGGAGRSRGRQRVTESDGANSSAGIL